MKILILFQPKTKKKFIDKKNAVTFHLVHRSQHDPLVADETAPQHVLLESNPQVPIQIKKNEVYINKYIKRYVLIYKYAKSHTNARKIHVINIMR